MNTITTCRECKAKIEIPKDCVGIICYCGTYTDIVMIDQKLAERKTCIISHNSKTVKCNECGDDVEVSPDWPDDIPVCCDKCFDMLSYTEPEGEW